VAEESARKLIELAETRKGTWVQADAELPAGFTPPSAALAPSVEPVNMSAANVDQGSVQPTHER
jgi:hypothetical protein